MDYHIGPSHCTYYIILILFMDKYSLNSVEDWHGIGYIHPMICSLMVLNLLALAGLPPTSGFVAKFYIFASIIKSQTYYWLAVIAILNTVIALYYYFNIARAMFLESPSDRAQKELDTIPVIVIVITSIQGILFYIYWSDLYNIIQRLFV